MVVILLLLALVSCSTEEAPRPTGEFVYREEGEYIFKPEPSRVQIREAYPWEEGKVGKFPRITKEYFRCKGSSLNPTKKDIRGGETLLVNDCGGADKHSLPLINGKEGVYPIMIEILNYIQFKLKKRVVVTSGHRCPDHNMYIDPSPRNQSSKHLIGAEVSFYVQGMEDKPEAIVDLIQAFYKEDLKLDKKYKEFTRYDKEDVDVSTPPWMNQEIFIKLYKKKEGRDFENRHPYPYLSLQVRFDRDKNERVFYSWDKAYNNYLRF